MGVSCEAYIGYTVTLKRPLCGDDFDFFNEFCESHNEYNQYDCEGAVLLAVDGMCGEYARLVFVDKHIDSCWVEGEDYFALKNHNEPPDNIYEELNKAYKAMYGKDLDKGKIEYALWFYYC